MKIYYITGTSRGLGSALAAHFLAQGERVIGIGRTCKHKHPNYSHVYADLADSKTLPQLILPEGITQVTLINNAGTLGEIKRYSEKRGDDYQTVFQLNLHSPLQLMAMLSNQLLSDQQLNILNISSGAAERPIPGWLHYCASKAALNMSSAVFLKEEIERQRKVRVVVISPGVIDTSMQELIRSTSEADFSSSAQFHQLKAENALQSPENVALKIAHLSSQLTDEFQVIRLTV